MSRRREPDTEAWKTWGTPPLGGDMYEWQDGRCAWCGTTTASRYAKDHCHMTGLVRGRLCAGCNVREGKAFGTEWDGWRNGDHPAAAMRFAEVYVGWNGTTYSPQSALHYYSEAERRAYWDLIPKLLANAEYPWPTEAPWTDMALERQQANRTQMQAAMGGWDFLNHWGSA